jgi:hypothetical protein
MLDQLKPDNIYCDLLSHYHKAFTSTNFMGLNSNPLWPYDRCLMAWWTTDIWSHPFLSLFYLRFLCCLWFFFLIGLLTIDAYACKCIIKEINLLSFGLGLFSSSPGVFIIYFYFFGHFHFLTNFFVSYVVSSRCKTFIYNRRKMMYIKEITLCIYTTAHIIHIYLLEYK